MPTTKQLREGLRSLSTLAARDLDVIWRDVSNAALTGEALRDVLPDLVRTYGNAAATIASDWYDDYRDQRGVKKAFRAVVPEIGSMGADSLAGHAIGPLYGANPDGTIARSILEGGLERRITNAGRLAIMESSLADPSSSGWQRETDGDACAFCEMLAGRGEVYSESSADFASHDWCGCSAVPAFDGQPRPVKPYTPSSRNITDADRARVRAYLSDGSNGGVSPSKPNGSNAPTGFKSLSVETLKKQLAVIEKLPDNEYKRAQIPRLRNRIAELGG